MCNQQSREQLAALWANEARARAHQESVQHDYAQASSAPEGVGSDLFEVMQRLQADAAQASSKRAQLQSESDRLRSQGHSKLAAAASVLSRRWCTRAQEVRTCLSCTNKSNGNGAQTSFRVVFLS